MAQLGKFTFPFPNVQSVLIHPLKHEVIHENNPDLSQTNKVIYDNYDIVIKNGRCKRVFNIIKKPLWCTFYGTWNNRT